MSVATFELTPANEASAPAAERDEVRLLVAQRGRPLVHDRFRGLPDHLRAGDLLEGDLPSGRYHAQTMIKEVVAS